MSRQNDKPAKTCSYCQKPQDQSNSLQVCSGCKVHYYCGVKCQKLHWPRHKSRCKDIKENPQQAALAKKAMDAFDDNVDLFNMVALIAYHRMQNSLNTQSARPCIIHVMITSFSPPDINHNNPSYTVAIDYMFPDPNDIVNYEPDQLNIMLSTILDGRFSMTSIRYMDLNAVKKNYLGTNAHIDYSKYAWPAKINVSDGKMYADAADD